MKRHVLIFGLISGAISSAMMFITLPLLDRGIINFDNGELIGYTAIFLSFLLVFFGIRSYRESIGGTITFGRAFKVGILITLISCAFYVASWEIIYFKLMPDFVDKYSNEMAALRKLYENPLINAAMTFLEPLPVGLVVTLVSAGILRRRESGVSGNAATTVVS
jgi:hypothetical protein